MAAVARPPRPQDLFMDRTTQRAYVGVSITAAAVAIAHLTLSVGARNPQSIPERFAIAFDLLSQLPLATVTLLNLCLCVAMVISKFTTDFFFGRLRDDEIKALYARLLDQGMYKGAFLWILSDSSMEELVVWAGWLIITTTLRMVSMLCRDRFSVLAISPNVSMAVHLKMFSLLTAILGATMSLVGLSVVVMWPAGLWTVLILVLQGLTIVTETAQTLVRYTCHLLGMFAQANEVPWEAPDGFISQADMFADAAVAAMTFVHDAVILFIHGISFAGTSLLLMSEMRGAFVVLRSRLTQWQSYRRTVHSLAVRYADATEDDLTSYNDDCAICRERMASAKKLACGHIFHVACLRSWLAHQSTCPICRRSVNPAQPTDDARPPLAASASSAPAHRGSIHLVRAPTPTGARAATPTARAATPTTGGGSGGASAALAAAMAASAAAVDAPSGHHRRRSEATSSLRRDRAADSDYDDGYGLGAYVHPSGPSAGGSAAAGSLGARRTSGHGQPDALLGDRRPHVRTARSGSLPLRQLPPTLAARTSPAADLSADVAAADLPAAPRERSRSHRPPVVFGGVGRVISAMSRRFTGTNGSIASHGRTASADNLVSAASGASTSSYTGDADRFARPPLHAGSSSSALVDGGGGAGAGASELAAGIAAGMSTAVRPRWTGLAKHRRAFSNSEADVPAYARPIRPSAPAENSPTVPTVAPTDDSAPWMDQARMIATIFPQATVQAIAQDLVRTRSVDRTVDNLLQHIHPS